MRQKRLFELELPTPTTINKRLTQFSKLILQALEEASALTTQLFNESTNGVLPGGQLDKMKYIGVGDSDDVQLFYYFVKSESNPKSNPFILWLTGGPGCSALSGLLYEIGPITFEPVEYSEFKPTEYNGESSLVASFIFLDLPIGTGFSYARTSAARQSDDLQASDHAYQFLRKWFNDHPEFLRNPFYVAGDSYAGIGVPIISQLIANGNEKGLEPFIDLKGYLLGNPATFYGEYNYKIPYTHGLGLISDEIFESLKRNCKGEYFDIHPSNTQCWNERQTYDQMLGGITNAHILEPKCEFASPRPQKWLGHRRSLDEMLYLGRLRCRFDWEKIYYHWAGDDKVREALHVRRGSIGKWKRCAGDALPFQKIVENNIPYHANLSVKGYRSLIYRMKEGDTVKEYSGKLLEIVNKIRLFGETFPDSKMVEKMMIRLPAGFESKISAREESCDLKTLSVAEMISKLQAQE
ncbi:putative serine carboxypeptidase-like 19-like [Capsicum annuum]|uniref:Uncharacterized protein n=1 Tax=Capsicum annuum TaxID=4072 RepID=A0A2G2ZQR9_CAPAN|nr:putative serine carboxypeptidase-like 19-like [Capsicum annuum]PHT84330.1 hypothetical protein T459_12773 [Capsicum annuum]